MDYESNLTNEQWEKIKDIFPSLNIGRKRKFDRRTLVNAIFYKIKNRIGWKRLPKDFPSPCTVYSFYYISKKKGLWDRAIVALSGISE